MFLLESANLLTVRTLLREGVLPRMILIPNPCPTACAAIRAAAAQQDHGLLEMKLTVLPITSHEFLQKQTFHAGFSFVWLDYCGTWGSCSKAGRKREQDVASLFKHKMLRTPSVLAVTLSERGGGGTNGVDLVDQLVLFVETAAANANVKSVRVAGALRYFLFECCLPGGVYHHPHLFRPYTRLHVHQHHTSSACASHDIP